MADFDAVEELCWRICAFIENLTNSRLFLLQNGSLPVIYLVFPSKAFERYFSENMKS
jgi:hypothetical protein